MRPRKIKRITLEAFLRIKELLKKIKRPWVNKKWQHHKKPLKTYKRTNNNAQEYKRIYEPSEISDTYDSTFWGWRKVIAWEKYINDPLENKKGHKTMI